MPGVAGVKGVVGVAGERAPGRPRASWLEVGSAGKSDDWWSGLSSRRGGGEGRPSWDTTRLKVGVWLLLVAKIRGVPTGQYMAAMRG